MTKVGLFYQPRRPPIVPDALLSLDVRSPVDPRLKSSRSYFVWEYRKVPEVVVEVVSNREGGEDSDKLEIYEQIGIRYYAIYDPDCFLSNDALRVFRLQGSSYEKMNDPIWFPDLNLGLTVWEGNFEGMNFPWVRWVDSQGKLILTGDENTAVARERADRLAERLRQLGVDPNL